MMLPYERIRVRNRTGNHSSPFVYRPMLTILATGKNTEPTKGLIDSGSDHTLLPFSFIDMIDVKLEEGSGEIIEGIGGQMHVVRFGKVEIEVDTAKRKLRWKAKVGFIDGSQKTVLGHRGFLEKFIVRLDGPNKRFTLNPCSELLKSPKRRGENGDDQARSSSHLAT
ncbi:hypothetical protein [Singulisphaera sp. PoT]|uniref:hypothetical protein n=1 Tax=Singulisphaera sp. PoT TaxID=3411797 RepID=UPI003BF5E2FF